MKLPNVVKSAEEIIGELEVWSNKYLPEDAQLGKIELVDIVLDKPLKSFIRWLQWHNHQTEADEMKEECSKILRWRHTTNGVLSQNLNENPFVANQKGFGLKLTDILRDMLEIARSELKNKERPKLWITGWIFKKTSHLIYFLAALLTCIYLLWWLWTKFSA